MSRVNVVSFCNEENIAPVIGAFFFICFHFCFQFPFPVSVSFPFPAFPYAHLIGTARARRRKSTTFPVDVTRLSPPPVFEERAWGRG